MKNLLAVTAVIEVGAGLTLVALPSAAVTLVLGSPLDTPAALTAGADAKSLLGYAGSLGSPSTAYIYDWNVLPIGQLLWEKELMSYKTFPPLQDPESYNLVQVLQ
jgi:hypothetical protein